MRKKTMTSEKPATNSNKPSLGRSILGTILGISLIFVQYLTLYKKDNIIIDILGVVVTVALAILVARVFAPKELTTFNAKTIAKGFTTTKTLNTKLLITIAVIFILRFVFQPSSFINIAVSFPYFTALHTSTAFIEEVTFRAIVLTALINMMPNSGIDKKAPILISAIFFSMFHVIIGNPFASVIRIILSGTLGYLCGKWMVMTKSIISGIIAHFTTNMTLAIVSSQLIDGTYPTSFDRGVVVVCFIAIVVLMLTEISKINRKTAIDIEPIN